MTEPPARTSGTDAKALQQEQPQGYNRATALREERPRFRRSWLGLRSTSFAPCYSLQGELLCQRRFHLNWL